MPTYDFCCIASARVTNEHLVGLISKISGDVIKRGGIVRRIEHYGVRPLAYPIRAHSHKHEVGRYFRMFVQASPISAEDVAHRLKVDEGIIRFRPFKADMNDIFDVPTTKWQHKPKLTPGHYDALKRSTNIDYYIARTLLKRGKMTVDEIKALGTHSIKLEPYIAMSELANAASAFQDTPETDAIDDLIRDAPAEDAVADEVYGEEVDVYARK